MNRFSGHNLTCTRAQAVVFQNLSFEIESGKILALTGANGSGKTSLLRIMAGLLAPVAGKLTWNGNDRIPDGLIHWVGTENALKPDLSVRENLEFWVGEENADMDSALSKLSLSTLAETPVRYLSVGQRRRVTLCRLFLAPRSLWLLDEPETGLDAQNAYRLRTLSRQHTQGGGMVVIATHRPEVWDADMQLEIGGHA